MPFGVVSGIGRGVGVVDGGGDFRRGRSSSRVNLGCPIVTSGDFVARATRFSQVTFGRTCWRYVALVVVLWRPALS